jgi:hypothetical protein
MKIDSEVKKMSTIVLGGLYIAAECDSHLFKSVEWHTVALAFAQFLGLLRRGSCPALIGYVSLLLAAAAGTKLVMPVVIMLAQAELLRRFLGDRLRVRGWWVRSIRYREARFAPVVLGLSRRSYSPRA